MLLFLVGMLHSTLACTSATGDDDTMRNIMKPPTNYVPPGAPAMAPSPAPTGMVGPNTPPAGTTNAPIDNRVLAPSQYSASIQVPTPDKGLVSVLNVNWRQPTPFTVYAETPFDTYNPLDFPPEPPAKQTNSSAQVRMIIEWGDVNQQYRRDVGLGFPLTFVGSYCKISAYIAPYGNLGGTIDNATALLNVIVTGDNVGNDVSRNLDTESIVALSVDSDVEWGTLASNLSLLTGYNGDGADLYVMLFDSFTTVNDGDQPNYQFKVPASQNFSLGFGQGLTFLHKPRLLWSSTPGVLSTATPTSFAVNVTYQPFGRLQVGG